MRDPVIGPGGAPTRETSLPEAASERKKFPVASGFLDYFPDAVVAVSEISYAGNEQHNPGTPLQWTRSKSGDEANACIRHFLARGTRDIDGKRHTAKFAWRAMALLQKEIEADQIAQKAVTSLLAEVGQAGKLASLSSHSDTPVELVTPEESGPSRCC